jgi:hypothetical protein
MCLGLRYKKELLQNLLIYKNLLTIIVYKMLFNEKTMGNMGKGFRF